jgi:hypothetical protein
LPRRVRIVNESRLVVLVFDGLAIYFDSGCLAREEIAAIPSIGRYITLEPNERPRASGRCSVEARSRVMRVRVRPINVNGRPQFQQERERRELYVGELKVQENRLHQLGRVVTTASIVNVTDNATVTMLELFDVVLLWAEGNRIRMRGFEMIDNVQYAQTWDVEVA